MRLNYQHSQPTKLKHLYVFFCICLVVGNLLSSLTLTAKVAQAAASQSASAGQALGPQTTERAAPPAFDLRPPTIAKVDAAPVAAPLAQALTGSNVLTITKTVNWSGLVANPSKLFNLTITGPSYPSGQADTIIDGQTKVYTGLLSGVYTVTETSPGLGWTTVYTATPGTGGSSRAVVMLQNANTATLVTTPISGKVFRDFNSDGQITVNGVTTDTGISNVIVTAYDKTSTIMGNATSNATGNYTINPTGAGPYRVVFSNIPSGYEPTTHGTDNGTSVQFVTTTAGATNVNLGLSLPDDYSQSNPSAIPVFSSVWFGSAPSDDVTIGAQPSVQKFTRTDVATPSYTVINLNPNVSGTPLALTQQTGTLGSAAIDRTTRTIYEATTARRGADYGPGADGVLGTADDAGAIYLINSVTPNLSGNLPTLNVPNAGPTVPTPRGIDGEAFAPGGDFEGETCTSIASNPRPSEPVDWLKDSCAFDLPGKQGLGDIQMDQANRILYVVNLYDRHLYAFDVSSGNVTTIQSTLRDIGPLTGASYPTCPHGEWRPHALEWHNGALYVGGVCSAEYNDPNTTTLAAANADLSAHVFRLTNPATGTTATEIYSQPLTYGHQPANDPGSTLPWLPWYATLLQGFGWTGDPGESVQGSPMLVDLTFDVAGNMLLGFADRAAAQHLHLPPLVDDARCL